MRPPNLNQPSGRSVQKLVEDIEHETRIKSAFKGVRGGRKATAAVKAGRRIRAQQRGGRK